MTVLKVGVIIPKTWEDKPDLRGLSLTVLGLHLVCHLIDCSQRLEGLRASAAFLFLSLLLWVPGQDNGDSYYSETLQPHKHS